MAQTGAVVFLPHDEGQISRMLQDILFDPAALWLAQALSEQGVERFFVVCHGADRVKAQMCFPSGTQFVTQDTEDAGTKLAAFLAALEGSVTVVTRPVFLLTQGQAAPPVSVPLREAGVFTLEAEALALALEDGEPLDAALRARASQPQQGRAILLSPLLRDRQVVDSAAKAAGVERTAANGVRIMDPSNTYVGPQVQVGVGTLLLPGTILRGKTVIGMDCEIGPHTMIRDCVLSDNVTVNQSQLNESTVEAGAKVGPFAYIRPGCHVGRDVKVGDFVELKNSTIGEGTKISHLTYVGDSDVGRKVNFGCGTVTVNYDGAAKFRTTIGDNAFIGCNTNLVAPVKVGDGAYTAAGSTITDEVPADSLAIARSIQVNKKQWAAKRRKSKRLK